jgi:hypothetical protein
LTWNPFSVSGLHYLLHLVDQTSALLKSLKLDIPAILTSSVESTRMLTDRVSYLERDHSRVVRLQDSKIADDAEFDDWVRNRNEEDWIVITGLPRLSGSLTRQAWQSAVKDQVSEAVKHVLHSNRVRLEFEVVLVTNATRGRTTGRTVYNVQLSSVEVARRIRELFSGFFRRHNPVRMPQFLNGVSFRNKITFETRIRIAILRQLGQNYKDRNEGASFLVRGYDSRPLLVITPPSGTDNARPRTMTYPSAIKFLPVTLSDDNLVQIFRVIGSRLRGHLRETFVILDDDQHDRALELVKASDAAAGRSRSLAPAHISSANSFAGVVVGTGTGMDVDANITPEGPKQDPRAHTRKRQRSRSRSRSPVSCGRSKRRNRSRSRSRSRTPERSKKSSHKSRSRNRRKSPTSSSSSSTSSDSSETR